MKAINKYRVIYQMTQYNNHTKEFKDYDGNSSEMLAYSAEDAHYQATVMIKNINNYFSHKITNIEPVK